MSGKMFFVMAVKSLAKKLAKLQEKWVALTKDGSKVVSYSDSLEKLEASLKSRKKNDAVLVFIPQSDKLYVPAFYWREVFLVSSKNHRVGRSIQRVVDSGADFNLFPAKYAQVYFGFSEADVRKGKPLSVGGISKDNIYGYKHMVNLHGVGFSFGEVPVYFSFDFSYLPLLGREGFFDRFFSIKFCEMEKVLVINTKWELF